MKELDLNEQPWLLVIAIIIGFTILMPIIWCGIVWLLSRLSGWGRLARTYESNRAFGGEKHTGQSARVGLVNYNRIVTLHSMPDGLGFAVMPLFTAGHPNLLIPWSNLKAEGQRKVFSKVYQIYRTSEPSAVKITIPAGIAPQDKIAGNELIG